ncbi:MAG: hypothetical protein ACTSYC_04335 [Promethearchaeota archaeon]
MVDDDIYKLIFSTLKSRNLSQIKKLFDGLKRKNYFSTKYKQFSENKKNQIEDIFYSTLRRYLTAKKFKHFRELIKYAPDLQIFLDPNKIPNRFEILTHLHLLSLQSGQIGDIIEILRFFNEFNLLQRELSDSDLKDLELLKRNSLLIANLKDLFHDVNDYLLYHVYKVIPWDLFHFFLEYLSTPYILDENLFSGIIYMSYPPNRRVENFISEGNYKLNFILNYLDNYIVYGLRVEKISDLTLFLKTFDHVMSTFINTEISWNKKVLDYIKMRYKNKLHLISPSNIKKIKEKALDPRNYNFYNISMVLLGGIGPQGHGFTYSTPRGELVEICSDRRENEAIIVKYKQFLKSQFLKKLKKELNSLMISLDMITKIMDYLSEILENEEVVNYYKSGEIVTNVRAFLYQSELLEEEQEKKIDELINKISDALSLILREIKLEDQFKTRMDLVVEDQIRSEDVAKLTSLRGKSHYDVLRERFFFQYIVKWFHEIYLREIQKFKDF